MVLRSIVVGGSFPLCSRSHYRGARNQQNSFNLSKENSLKQQQCLQVIIQKCTIAAIRKVNYKNDF